MENKWLITYAIVVTIWLIAFILMYFLDKHGLKLKQKVIDAQNDYIESLEDTVKGYETQSDNLAKDKRMLQKQFNHIASEYTLKEEELNRLKGSYDSLMLSCTKYELWFRAARADLNVAKTLMEVFVGSVANNEIMVQYKEDVPDYVRNMEDFLNKDK